MATYPLGQLRINQLEELVEIEDRGIVAQIWEDRELGKLSEREQLILSEVHERLGSVKPLLVNEATLWARAIYPLLMLAERDNIRAFAGVPLSATFGRGELRGEVDGALARMGIEGDAIPPYLLVVEAKRGVEGHDPVAQLIGGLLCAARRNHEQHARNDHVLYGVYTVAHVWTFVQATIQELDSDRPRIAIVSSSDYGEKMEAATIVLLLKSVVGELISR
jgi:hypothetical protein